jgi:hypothetical protein
MMLKTALQWGHTGDTSSFSRHSIMARPFCG